VPARDPLRATIDGALRQIDLLARDVRALVDWSLPAESRPLECGLEEIGLAAVDALPPARRDATLVAVESPATRVHVDGPLASRALARLVEYGLALGAEHARLQLAPCDSGFAAVAAFDGAGEVEDSISATLADALAHRDLARLGAHIAFDAGARRTTITFPATGGPR
jgi:hypothetical protein